MSYQALYRTYRPKCFEEVIGQDFIVRTLKNALKDDKISHAYLFCGPRGTGKTSIAKIFAKALNCEKYPSSEPCLECHNCLEIQKGSFVDVIEMDAASNNGVDEIREIRDNVNFMPSEGRYKVYIIDEVHMLTTQAFNALLKTLEEPPKHVVFVLATTEPHKIPATILSRCQKYEFKAVSKENIFIRLKEVSKSENINIEDDALNVISENALGGMRDALSLLDQAISYKENNITEEDIHQISGSVSAKSIIEILKNLENKEVAKALDIIENLVVSGKECSKIINDFILFYRDVLLYKSLKQVKDNLNNQDFFDVCQKLTTKKIYQNIQVLNEAQNNMRFTNLKRVYLEIAILKIAEDLNQNNDFDQEKYDELLNRLTKLENNNKNISPIIVERKIENRGPVKIEEVEYILTHPNKNKKDGLLKFWKELAKIEKPGITQTARLLFRGQLVATSDDTILLSFDDKMSCNKLMSRENLSKALELFNEYNFELKNLIAIGKDKWELVKEEFMNQWNSGNRNPKLSNIDLEVTYEYQAKNVELDTRSEIEKVAEELFGKENIIIKEN